MKLRICIAGEDMAPAEVEAVIAGLPEDWRRRIADAVYDVFNAALGYEIVFEPGDVAIVDRPPAWDERDWEVAT